MAFVAPIVKHWLEQEIISLQENKFDNQNILAGLLIIYVTDGNCILMALLLEYSSPISVAGSFQDLTGELLSKVPNRLRNTNSY